MSDVELSKLLEERAPRVENPIVLKGQGLVWLSAIVALALGGAFFFGRSTAPEPIRPDALRPLSSNPGPADKVALAIAYGQTREDGITYGEFLRIRLGRLCPSAEDISPTIGRDGSGTLSLWKISIHADGEYCVALQHNRVYVAGVWSDNGEVIPLPEDGRLERRPRNDPSYPSLLRNQPNQGGWLADFRDGAKP